MTRRYIAVGLKERIHFAGNPKYLIYAETEREIKEINIEMRVEHLAESFRKQEFNKAFIFGYNANFAISYQPTISLYFTNIRPNQVAGPNAIPFDVMPLTQEEREIFESILFSELGLEEKMREDNNPNELTIEIHGEGGTE